MMICFFFFFFKSLATLTLCALAEMRQTDTIFLRKYGRSLCKFVQHVHRLSFSINCEPSICAHKVRIKWPSTRLSRI